MWFILFVDSDGENQGKRILVRDGTKVMAESTIWYMDRYCCLEAKVGS
jgi:hypothetical protein